MLPFISQHKYPIKSHTCSDDELDVLAELPDDAEDSDEEVDIELLVDIELPEDSEDSELLVDIELSDDVEDSELPEDSVDLDDSLDPEDSVDALDSELLMLLDVELDPLELLLEELVELDSLLDVDELELFGGVVPLGCIAINIPTFCATPDIVTVPFPVAVVSGR